MTETLIFDMNSPNGLDSPVAKQFGLVGDF